MVRKLLDSAWFYFGLAGILLVLAVLSQFEFKTLGRPAGQAEQLLELREREHLNVVFIIIDMLRADRLSAYGYERDTSPVMKQLADRGIRFNNVESQSSWTKASMASMWTGMYPQRTGVHRYPHALPQDATMPAEIFRDAGYRTAGIWRNGWVANNFGFDQGFELYIRPRQNAQARNVKRNNPSAHQLTGTDLDATESATEFIVNNASEPFFLYIHYMDVHQYLYADLSPDFGTSFSDIYDSSIYWTDINIQYIMNALRDAELADKTLVVIASDHGEAFFEHGEEGHARSIYRETQRVPFIIIPPFQLDPGIVVNENVANVDIMPTILDLVGLDPLPGAEGQSLVPLILETAKGRSPGAADLGDRSVFSQLDRTWGRSFGEVGNNTNRIVALQKGEYRLVHQENFPNKPELFNHKADPAEQSNVAHIEREVTRAMTAEVQEFLEGENTEWGAAEEVELDEMRLHQLRALGYFVDGGGKGGMKPLGEVLEQDKKAREAVPDYLPELEAGAPVGTQAAPQTPATPTE